MEKKALFYQESGIINPINQSISYILSIGISLVLGSLYTIIIFIIPFIYLNFLISIGFGIVLGIICSILIRFSHNRSRRSQIIHAVIFGLLANYFQWSFFVIFSYFGYNPDISLNFENLFWAINPFNLFPSMMLINSIGSWSIFGITFNGILLTIVWLIEFIIIISLPSFIVLKKVNYPYSESLQKWYHKYTLIRDFESMSTVDDIINDLVSDPVKTIDDFKCGFGYSHTKIHIYYLKDEEKQYLTFERVFIDNFGKGVKKSKAVINKLLISNSDAVNILAKFENKRDKYYFL